jgi:hypothetical protein
VLLLPACAGSETPLPATTKILDDLPRVQNSTKAPCWLQQQIAKQNSYVDTIRDKAERVYKPPCEIDRQKVASSSTPPR